jgi:hypothetical protein
MESVADARGSCLGGRGFARACRDQLISRVLNLRLKYTPDSVMTLAIIENIGKRRAGPLIKPPPPNNRNKKGCK